MKGKEGIDMVQTKSGDRVKIHYTGKLEDGTIFADSKKGEPLEFTLGAGQVIPGVDEAVHGMEPGQSKKVTIPSDKAYGPRREELTQDIPKDQLPEEMQPQVGQRMRVDQPNGEPMIVSITAVSDSNITIDANHPLAGKDLDFELELLEVFGTSGEGG
jgi:peptidylprolyl isomerase